MSNKKNESKSLTSDNSTNANYSQIRSLFISEMNKINQDLIFFKNDLLLDIRKVEERFNYKLTEQNIISSEQYESFENKISELKDRISKIDSKLLDNNEFTEKTKNFLKFKTKADENFNRINAKITTLQKENREFINNIERMVNENLRYPGVIGRNAKFLNFRYFIDYTLKNFKDFNEFMNDIRSFDFNAFKKKINSDITDFRFSISDNYKNSVRLIGNSFKEFDLKIEDLMKRNNKNMRENEAKFEELTNNINNYFSEYKAKFESLEKSINEKYNDQIKEIDNIKEMKNDLSADINNFKSYIELIKTSNFNNNNNKNENANNNINDINENINNNINENVNNNIINLNINNKNIINKNNQNKISNNGLKNTRYENQNNLQYDSSSKNILLNQNNKNEYLQYDINSGNFGYQTISSSNKKYKRIINDLINNNGNINIIDNYQNSEVKHNTDIFFHAINNNRVLDRSKSYEKLPINNYSKISNKNKDISLTRNEIKKQEEKKEFETYFNTTNKDLRRNNYSISNIADIKIKKVILPEYLCKRNIKRNSFISDNKGAIFISNDLSSTIYQKSIYFNENSSSKRKSAFNISKINKQKAPNNKNKNLIQSANTNAKKVEIKNQGRINSLMVIKSKSNNNILNSKKSNLSFEKEKNLKDEQIQIGFRKTLNLKTKIKDLILMNAKNFKKNRKIQI